MAAVVATVPEPDVRMRMILTANVKRVEQGWCQATGSSRQQTPCGAQLDLPVSLRGMLGGQGAPSAVMAWISLRARS